MKTSPDKTKILIADDDQNIQFAFRKAFEEEGFQVVTADNGREALQTIVTENPSLVFMDITMPEISGLDALTEIKKTRPDLPVILITGYGTMETAVKAIQSGAYEYITKPLDIDKIYVVTRRALEMVRLQNEVRNLREQVSSTSSEHEIIGRHPTIQEVYKSIGAITTTPNLTNVLITGESGTGKELVARAIHNSGGHAKEPFVAVNCTVLPETLLESELFGHEKGAFTGAVDRKIGKFEKAGAGTIFLDEIGDITPELQKKLLRVVQEREFERVGGNDVIPVNARFVASTNRDLFDEVRKGRFREDLFFRLNVVHIPLPPLRHRLEDIPMLVDHFLQKYAPKFGKKIRAVSDEALEFLQGHAFAGNVRELENIVERAIMATQGEILLSSALPENLRTPPDVRQFEITTFDLEAARRQANDQFEKEFIRRLLSESQGNVSLAAEMAGVDRRTIQRLMRKFDLDRQHFK